MHVEYNIAKQEDIELLNGYIRDCSFNIEDVLLDSEAKILKIRYGYLDSENSSRIEQGAVYTLSVPVVEGFIFIKRAASFLVFEKSGHGSGEIFLGVEYHPDEGRLFFSTMFAKGIEARVDALSVRVVITDKILGYREVAYQI